MTDLTIGSRGDEVAELNRLLIASGEHDVLPGDLFTRATYAAVADYQARHLGPDGKPLSVDGVAGNATWWALHAPAISQHSFIAPNYRIPEGLSPVRKALLEIALEEYGKDVHEVPMGSNRGERIDVYTGFTNQPDSVLGPAWCMFNATWLQHEALGFHPLRERVGGCVRARELAIRQGCYVEANEPGAVMVPGDCAILLHRDPNGQLNGKGHAMTVAAVSQDQTRFNTLEGNCGNRFKLGLRETSTVDGWWHPCDIGSLPTQFECGVFDSAVVAQEATT